MEEILWMIYINDDNIIANNNQLKGFFMMDKDFADKLDKTRNKLRVDENHHTKWVKICDIAIMLNLSDEEIMIKVKEFGLHITSDVTSLNSCINQSVSKEFIKFITNAN